MGGQPFVAPFVLLIALAWIAVTISMLYIGLARRHGWARLPWVAGGVLFVWVLLVLPLLLGMGASVKGGGTICFGPAPYGQIAGTPPTPQCQEVNQPH